MTDPTSIHEALASAVAVTLLWSGVPKLRGAHELTRSWLAQIGVARRAGDVIAAASGPVEVVLAAVVVSGALPVVTGGSVAALGSVFLGLHVRARRRDVRTPCFCLGNNRTTGARVPVVVASMLVALSTVAAVFSNGFFFEDPRAGWLAVGVLCSLAVLGAVALVQEVLFFEDNRSRPLSQPEVDVA